MEDWQNQGSDAWKNFRKGKITGTMAATCMNLNPYDNQYDLWRRCLGLLPEVQENEMMRRGKELEPIARKEFEAVTGIMMKPHVCVHPYYNWMSASLDGIDNSGTKILEVKCGGHELHELAAVGGIPDHYKCQIQHCLEVSQAEIAFYCSYRNGEVIILEIYRDEKFIKEMLDAEKEFHRRLKEFDPPTPKHKKIETKEMEYAVETYRIAKDMMSRAEENEKNARSTLISLAGGYCVEGYGLKVTHYTQKGAVDYENIPELEGVNLEKYRKPPSVRSRITV